MVIWLTPMRLSGKSIEINQMKVPGQNAPWCLPLHTLFQAIYPHTPECWGQLHWTDCTLTWETDRKWNNLIWEGPNDNCAHLRGLLSIVVQSPCQVWHQPSSQLCSSLWFCARSPAKDMILYLYQSVSVGRWSWKKIHLLLLTCQVPPQSCIKWRQIPGIDLNKK